jgi:hypothetical protein
MISLSFSKCDTEHALYTRQSRWGLVIVEVYVDDLIVTRESKEDTIQFKSKMMKRFKMSDLSLLTYYLGVEVQQRKDATLKQSSYAWKLVERGGLSGAVASRIKPPWRRS